MAIGGATGTEPGADLVLRARGGVALAMTVIAAVGVVLVGIAILLAALDQPVSALVLLGLGLVLGLAAAATRRARLEAGPAGVRGRVFRWGPTVSWAELSGVWVAQSRGRSDELVAATSNGRAVPLTTAGLAALRPFDDEQLQDARAWLDERGQGRPLPPFRVPEPDPAVRFRAPGGWSAWAWRAGGWVVLAVIAAWLWLHGDVGGVISLAVAVVLGRLLADQRAPRPGAVLVEAGATGVHWCDRGQQSLTWAEVAAVLATDERRPRAFVLDTAGHAHRLPRVRGVPAAELAASLTTPAVR